MKKFINTLSESQQRKLYMFVQYEGLNLCLLTALLGSSIAANIALRRACRKYRCVLRFQAEIKAFENDNGE